MTDITANGVTSGARRNSIDANLVRKRYRAERRFRSYGLVAILATGAFLLVLFFDILRTGYPAFIEHRLLLPVKLDKEVIDPSGKLDEAALRAADYEKIVRDALRAQFPDVTSRNDRRALNELLSAGAADDLRRMIVADPGLVGTEAKIPILLSDDADLYIKGDMTDRRVAVGNGTLSIAVEGGAATLASSGPDFAPALADIRRFIERTIASAADQLERQTLAVGGLEARLSQAEAALVTAQQAGGDAAAAALIARDTAKAEFDKAATERDRLKALLDDLKARASATGGSEALDPLLPSVLVRANGGTFKATSIADSEVKAEILVQPRAEAQAAAGQWSVVVLDTPEGGRRVGDRQAAWLDELDARGITESGFAWRFLTSGDSREAELAGVWGGLMGSVLMLAVTLALCLPAGVAAAIYLEEFAPKNRITDLIEININNLAAVPSIVFGLLGLAVFLNFFALPRSAPLVGGLVMALLTLPTIIIAARAALKAVPPSIKEAALGVGASQQQAVFHHVLPLAMPGIMTGTILGMANALGETAPLLLIGMVAFIVDIPGGLTDGATVLPVQIYLWSDLPEASFVAKTAGAIIVLLCLLFAMNAAAIYLRKRFERRW